MRSTHNTLCAAYELYMLEKKMQKNVAKAYINDLQQGSCLLCVYFFVALYFFGSIYFLSNIFIKTSNSFYCYLD